jgi:hypothetical protein
VPANLERKLQMGKAPVGHDPAVLHAIAAAAEMPGAYAPRLVVASSCALYMSRRRSSELLIDSRPSFLFWLVVRCLQSG